MNGSILGALITSVTTVACLVYSNHRQLRTHREKIEAMTARQTDTITAHVSDTAKGEAQ